MSDETNMTRRKPVKVSQRKGPAGQPVGKDAAAALLEAMCASIRVDGVTEGQAALLAGITEERLRAWKRREAGCGLALATARADFHRGRLEQIRGACSREGVADWRAQAWLLEHTGPGEEVAKEEAPAVDRKKMRFNLVITTAHLHELQRRRMEALLALEAKKEAAV